MTGVFGIHVDDSVTGGQGSKKTRALATLKTKLEFRRWRVTVISAEPGMLKMPQVVRSPCKRKKPKLEFQNHSTTGTLEVLTRKEPLWLGIGAYSNRIPCKP